MGLRVTIRDVAKLSRTSVGTVSRFLNSGSCHPTRRKRIEEAIRSLGYVPNLNARATRSERSYSIGILIEAQCAGDGFWIQSLLIALLAGLSRSKFRAFSQIIDASDTQALAMQLSGNVDGVVVIGHFSEVFHKTLETFAIPAVTYWEPLPYSNGISLPVELESGFDRLIEHLTALGHRRIGVLGSTAGINPEKAELFLKIIRRYIPDYPEKLIILRDEPEKRECGRITTAELLEENLNVTAIFYLSDSIVLGGIGELARQKLVIPDDISIVSFDNSHLALCLEPQLTSVGFSYDEIAAKLVRELTLRLYSKDDSAGKVPESIKLEFYPRHSTGLAHS